MPLLRKGVLIPSQGIDYSQPALFIPERNGFPQNMRFYREEMRKRPGKIITGGRVADATQIMGFGKIELSSGSKHVVRASKRKLEHYNSTTAAWEVISSSNYNGGDEDFFSFADVTENELLIITNYFDAIRKWPGSGNDSALGGSPPKAKYVTYLSPYLLLAYINDGSTVSPWKIQWCDTGQPTVWSGGNSGSALVSSDASEIKNIAQLNEFVAVYKRESLHLGRKVDTSDVFLFDPIKTGIGLAASRAFAEAEGQHYFMANNDFYVWNGIQIDSIGKPVRDEVFSRVNRDKIQRCFALHIQELTEIWFFLVISGYSWPTEIWKYNYRTGFWYYDTCSQLTAAIRWQRINSLAWDNASGSWDEQNTIWDAGTTVAKWEDILFGDANGYSYDIDYTSTDDNGSAVSAQFVSKDFTGDVLEIGKRWLKIDVWAKGPGKLYIDYSIDEGSNWTNIPYTSTQAYINLTGEYTKTEMYFDVWADKIRFRFRNAESGETFYLRNFYPYYLNREEIATRRS